MTITSPPTLESALSAPDPGLAATVRAEWTKLWTAKGPKRNLILGTLVGITVSALLATATGATFDDWSAADRADFDPTLFAFSGSALTVIFFVAVGVRQVTAEYGADMMRLTLTVTPRRDRVVWAKALAVAAATWIFGALAMVGMVAAGQIIFALFDVETTGVVNGETLRTIALVVLFVPAYPLLGVVSGFLTRSTASAVTIVLALIFAPGMFGGLFPQWWRENVLSLLPGSVFDAISIGHLTESALYPSLAVAIPLAVAWIVGPLLLARAVVTRRDA